jgi:hypothetical protein
MCDSNTSVESETDGEKKNKVDNLKQKECRNKNRNTKKNKQMQIENRN